MKRFFIVKGSINVNITMETLFGPKTTYVKVPVRQYVKCSNSKEIYDIAKEKLDNIAEAYVTGEFCKWNGKGKYITKPWNWIIGDAYYIALKRLRFVKDWKFFSAFVSTEINLSDINELPHEEAAKHFTTNEIFGEE